MFRIRTALAGAAVALAATLALAAPASAHDTIVASSPAADEQLTAAPEEVVLTFSNDLLELEGNSGTAMTVMDADGTDWVDGEPVISADAVTVPLKSGMPNGEYQVTWKVVSSDGHPTSGEYAFSVAVENQTAPAVTEQPTATPEATAAETPAADAPDAEDSDADSAPWPLLIGLGVVLIAAVVIAIVIGMRKRRS